MKSLQGRFLIAAPKLVDPNFYRTVLLMVQHNDDGALGLVLNRPSATRVADVWSAISDGPCIHDGPVYQGGPCEGPLMLLHTHEPASQIAVGKGIHLSTEEDHLRWLVEHDAGAVKAFVGYAGWAPGQLEAEMLAGSWLHSPASVRSAIERVPDWEKLIRKLTPSLIEVKVVPPDPSHN
jgi:putative transcriptional regulator